MELYADLYYLYLATGPGGEKMFYSPRPDIDRAFWGERGYGFFISWAPPLPLAWAEYARAQWEKAAAGEKPFLRLPWGGRGKEAVTLEEKVKRATEVINRAIREVRGPGLGSSDVRVVAFRAGFGREGFQEVEDLSGDGSDPDGFHLGVNLSRDESGHERFELRRGPHGTNGSGPVIPPKEFVDAVRRALAGRKLLLDELAVAMEIRPPGPEGRCSGGGGASGRESAEVAREAGGEVAVDDGDLVSALQLLVLQGLAQVTPAVGLDEKGLLICRRCGERLRLGRSHCSLCGEQCYFCEACRSLGEARGCMPLFAAPRSAGPPPGKPVTHRLPYALSADQARAAGEAAAFLAGPAREALLWAVPGAGKTEACFPAVSAALSRGLRVLFASPRRDVIADLAGRFRGAYPDVDVRALYGGSADRMASSPLVLATTHQTVRFCGQFDLVILDEADAFPFGDEPMLARAVARARGWGSKLLYITATPREQMLKTARREKWPVINMVARFHRHPLPLPELKTDPCLVFSGDHFFIPEEVDTFVAGLCRTGSKLLIFVPRVGLAEPVGQHFREMLSDRDLQWSHAGDRQRGTKVKEFIEGQTKVFISTTILERGITVPGVNVLVLFAHEDKIFDSRSLVQMAGRAGRKPDAPSGTVVFWGAEETGAMLGAVASIEGWNREALALGLIKP